MQAAGHQDATTAAFGYVHDLAGRYTWSRVRISARESLSYFSTRFARRLLDLAPSMIPTPPERLGQPGERLDPDAARSSAKLGKGVANARCHALPRMENVSRPVLALFTPAPRRRHRRDPWGCVAGLDRLPVGCIQTNAGH